MKDRSTGIVSGTMTAAVFAAALATFVGLASPGTLRAAPFVRGDVDQSQSVDISDAVFLFNFLFLGGPEPRCLDAADAGDDERIDISDGIYLLSFLFLGGGPPPPPFPVCGEDPTADALDCRFHGYCTSCIEAAGELVAHWREEGLAEIVIERLYQAELAACNGPDVDSARASFVGAANVDLARLARLFLNDRMAPADYLQRMRDRSRKLRLARADRTWAVAYAAGDADGDLVPDDRDRCAGTPDLDPTDDTGCPPRDPPPEAPTPEEVRRAASLLGVVVSEACSEADPPSSSTPLKFGYNNVDRSTVNIAVTRVKNQPVGCKVFYEVDFRFYSPTRPDLPTTAYAQMVFRDSENTDTSPSGDSRQVFRVRETDVGGRKFLFENWKYYQLAKWRARTVNGSGFKSAWSGYATQAEPSFGEP